MVQEIKSFILARFGRWVTKRRRDDLFARQVDEALRLRRPPRV